MFVPLEAPSNVRVAPLLATPIVRDLDIIIGTPSPPRPLPQQLLQSIANVQGESVSIRASLLALNIHFSLTDTFYLPRKLLRPGTLFTLVAGIQTSECLHPLLPESYAESPLITPLLRLIDGVHTTVTPVPSLKLFAVSEILPIRQVPPLRSAPSDEQLRLPPFPTTLIIIPLLAAIPRTVAIIVRLTPALAKSHELQQPQARLLHLK